MIKAKPTMAKEIEKDYLQKANEIFIKNDVKGVRVCFEQASWNSSDGQIKTYYHIHVQHDDLPDFNSGMGDSNFERLLNKMKNVLLLELETQLYNLKYQKQIKELI